MISLPVVQAQLGDTCMSNRFIIRRLKPRFNAELNAIVCTVLQDVVEVDVLHWDGSGRTSLDLDES
jgi:hypothetical protein